VELLRKGVVVSPEKSGTIGWGCIGAFVLAWDVFAPETLSGAVDRALEHKTGKYLAIGAVAVTGAHLLNLIPEEIDPFTRAFSVLERVRYGTRTN